jgi:hypothetical protein
LDGIITSRVRSLAADIADAEVTGNIAELRPRRYADRHRVRRRVDVLVGAAMTCPCSGSPQRQSS